MNQEVQKDFAILFLSCDKNKDLWSIALNQFFEHFPDCPFKIYFGSNLEAFADHRVTPILSGEDKDWSSSFMAILEQISENNLFVILEDLLVVSTIDKSRFNACVEFMCDDKVNHIKYWPYPLPTQNVNEQDIFFSYDKGVPYRVSVCGFWKRQYLLKLIISGENPWNFEILGSYRSSYDEGFYGLKSALFDFINLVEKGKWVPNSVEKAHNLGISLQLGSRKFIADGGILKHHLQKIIFNLISKVPWRMRLAMMNRLRKLFICY